MPCPKSKPRHLSSITLRWRPFPPNNQSYHRQQRDYRADEDGLGPVNELDCMLARRQSYAPQVVINSQRIYQMSIDVSSPSRIMILTTTTDSTLPRSHLHPYSLS